MLLGSAIDAKMGDMMELAEKIKDTKTEDGEDPELATLSAKLNATGKDIDSMSNALKSAIDSLGQATSTLARKN